MPKWDPAIKRGAGGKIHGSFEIDRVRQGIGRRCPNGQTCLMAIDSLQARRVANIERRPGKKVVRIDLDRPGCLVWARDVVLRGVTVDPATRITSPPGAAIVPELATEIPTNATVPIFGGGQDPGVRECTRLRSPGGRSPIGTARSARANQCLADTLSSPHGFHPPLLGRHR